MEHPKRNAAGNLLFEFGDSESEMLTAIDLPALELQFSTNLTNWITVTNSMVLTNGRAKVEITPTSNRGYYRVVER